MKRAFLWMIVPALLIAIGFAQAPAPSLKTEQSNIKGCLGGSDPNYTVVENNTGHTFKITTSTVDLKPHLGHDVTLIGDKASVTSSATADNSFAVTELNMISEHCAAAAAASIAVPAATAGTPSDTASAPAPAPTAPASTTSTVTETAATPALVAPVTTSTVTEAAIPPAAAAPATTSTPAESTTTVPADTAAAPAIVTTPAETAAPVAATPPIATHPARSSARLRNAPQAAAAPTTTPDVSVTEPSEPVSTPAANTAAVSDSTSVENTSTPGPVAAAPAVPARGGSFWLLIAFAVVVIVLGTMAPLVSRWRKRRLLERTGAQNLSLNPVASSEQVKVEEPAPVKAA